MNKSSFISQRNTSFDSRYKFTAKELDNETQYTYFGARYYDSDISIWLSVDPMADQRSWLSPYNYCQLNPIGRVDPTGALDGDYLDWVKNNKTNDYVWMDNVTSPSNTPSGYTYVGSKDSDILSNLNIPNDFSSINSNQVTFGIDGDAGMGAPIGSLAKASGNISVTANVSYYNAYQISDNNSLGRKFEGITFNAYFSQSSASGNQDYLMSFKGYFAVQYGNQEYTSSLTPPKESSLYQAGAIPFQASIFISSNSINTSKSFYNAYISAGATNPNLTIPPKPIKMYWNLQKNHTIKPKL